MPVAYQTDDNGYYVGEVDLDESPLEPGVWLVPRNAYLNAPPPLTTPDTIQQRQGNDWVIVPYVVAPPDTPNVPFNDRVNAERDRRIAAGYTLNLPGKTIAIGGSDMDQRNIQALGLAAFMRVSTGQGATITQFRDNADVIHDLDQNEVLTLYTYAVGYVEALFHAAWVLKDDPNGPNEDFQNDANWPEPEGTVPAP